jgi:hypothetical protein
MSGLFQYLHLTAVFTLGCVADAATEPTSLGTARSALAVEAPSSVSPTGAVEFAGYTSSTHDGNLGGRAGAHAICNGEFAGGHFCTDWEISQAGPPPAPASGAWVDLGESDAATRRHRRHAVFDSEYICNGWLPGWTFRYRGSVLRRDGDLEVSNDQGRAVGNCVERRPLACCRGGTTVKFRGFTEPRTGALGGRSGAHAICAATFSGSHFCTDWEADQATIPAPIPATGAWIDVGLSDPRSRMYRSGHAVTVWGKTCAGWKSEDWRERLGAESYERYAHGAIVDAKGEIRSSLSNESSGCEVARPLACCGG